MLAVGGIVCTVVPNNNQSGHGMYQFSPELLLSAFSNTYGMKVLEIYVAVINSDPRTWINVGSLHDQAQGRNQSRFFTSDGVYLLAISQKTHDSVCTLLTHPPNQYSYEHGDWIA